jgi:HAD superfamily hydrolase (TIGR01484 family)
LKLSSILSFPPQTAKALLGVFFDIDDTLSTRGKILPEAYQALWSLKAAGLALVPITGRPAGWCDHIARMWPVDGVVGENGAFYFRYDPNQGRLLNRYEDSEEVRREKRQRLDTIKEEILASVPGAALTGDQPFRATDLAIDYAEDVPALGWDLVEKICDIFKKHGAQCKVSSIHVNGWFGDYDKLKMTRTFARERWGIDLEEKKDRFLFCGDSPNDEPMFRYFPYAAGVRNLLRFSDRMECVPGFIADHDGGQGFAQIAGTILALRAGDKHPASPFSCD